MGLKKLHIDILTLFPRFFDEPLSTSIVGKTIEKGLLEVKCRDIREWAEGEYRQVDDMPYGGGPGMVLMLEPIVRCVDAVLAERKNAGLTPEMLILCPRGRRLEQSMFEKWAGIDPDEKSLLFFLRRGYPVFARYDRELLCLSAGSDYRS